MAAPSLTGDVDVSFQQPELPGSPLHGLLAPTSGAAHVVLVGGAGEGGLLAPVAGVPPRQDRGRSRPRLPALRHESVDGELLDLGLEHFLTLVLDIVRVLRIWNTAATTLVERRKPDVK